MLMVRFSVFEHASENGERGRDRTGQICVFEENRKQNHHEIMHSWKLYMREFWIKRIYLLTTFFRVSSWFAYYFQRYSVSVWWAVTSWNFTGCKRSSMRWTAPTKNKSETKSNYLLFIELFDVKIRSTCHSDANKRNWNRLKYARCDCRKLSFGGWTARRVLTFYTHVLQINVIGFGRARMFEQKWKCNFF